MLPELTFYAITYNPEHVNLKNLPLMTPNYMMKEKRTDLLDGILYPWRRVIVNVWQMYNTDPGHLTRQEVIDALNIKLGGEFMSSIYLHRYVPSPSLGWQLKLVLADCDITKIDLGRQDVIDYIRKENIDWGRDVHIFNHKLDRSYYENVTYDKYVDSYKDALNVEHKARLLLQFNRVRISPPSGYIPLNYIENMTSKLYLNNISERGGIY